MFHLLETRERCVYVYASEAEGMARVTTADLEAGRWQVFDADGKALIVQVVTPARPNQRPWRLQPAPPAAARLQDVLHELRAVVVGDRRLTAAALRESLPAIGPG